MRSFPAGLRAGGTTLGNPQFVADFLELAFGPRLWAPAPDGRVAADSYRPLTDRVLTPPPARDLSPAFAVLALLLLAAERVTAARPSRTD